jgi:hypothetical protein
LRREGVEERMRGWGRRMDERGEGREGEGGEGLYFYHV